MTRYRTPKTLATVTATTPKIKELIVKIIGEKEKKKKDELWVMGRGSTMN